MPDKMNLKDMKKLFESCKKEPYCPSGMAYYLNPKYRKLRIGNYKKSINKYWKLNNAVL